MLGDFVIPLVILIFLFTLYQYCYPAYKMNQNYKAERYELEKKYNRLYKARKDLLMHFDWAISRGESLDRTENMGREVERMD